MVMEEEEEDEDENETVGNCREGNGRPWRVRKNR